MDPFDTIARVKELANATGCSLYAPRTQGIRVLEDSSTLECCSIIDNVPCQSTVSSAIHCVLVQDVLYDHPIDLDAVNASATGSASGTGTAALPCCQCLNCYHKHASHGAGALGAGAHGVGKHIVQPRTIRSVSCPLPVRPLTGLISLIASFIPPLRCLLRGCSLI